MLPGVQSRILASSSPDRRVEGHYSVSLRQETDDSIPSVTFRSGNETSIDQELIIYGRGCSTITDFHVSMLWMYPALSLVPRPIARGEEEHRYIKVVLEECN